MIENLDFLVDKNQIKLFLEQNASTIFGKSSLIDIIEIKRSHTYNPDSYNVLYKIKIDKILKEIRASASRILTNNKETEFKILKHFYDSGFMGPEYFVNKPLAFFKNYNLMFYENADGIPFIDQLNDSQEHLKKKIEKCATLVNKIHSIDKPDYPLWDANKLFTFQQYETGALKRYYPELRKEIESIMEKIRLKINKNFSPQINHGDFQPTNILFGEEKTYLIDFGLTCLSDREYDIATFVNQLRVMIKRFGNPDFFEELERHFLRNIADYDKSKYNIYSLLVNLRIMVTLAVTSWNIEYADKKLSKKDKDNAQIYNDNLICMGIVNKLIENHLPRIL